MIAGAYYTKVEVLCNLHINNSECVILFILPTNVSHSVYNIPEKI